MWIPNADGCFNQNGREGGLMWLKRWLSHRKQIEWIFPQPLGLQDLSFFLDGVWTKFGGVDLLWNAVHARGWLFGADKRTFCKRVQEGDVLPPVIDYLFNRTNGLRENCTYFGVRWYPSRDYCHEESPNKIRKVMKFFVIEW